MVFSSFSFLLLFLPAVLILYFLVPKKLRRVRNGVLLAFSLAFYFFGEQAGILIMLGVILLSWLCALLMERTGRRRLFLILDIAGSLGLLCVYKYAGFAVNTVNTLFGASLKLPEIVMPIGISFFTFQALSYVIDVCRGTVAVQRNPLRLALYVSFFPQLIAGPIVRYSTVAGEIGDRRESLEDVFAGAKRFIAGLGKKILLANTFAAAAETLFGLTERSAVLAWAGAVFYALQIFYDFSGYSDMAIGLGRIFGFHFLENFDYPYISKSVTEFWRRWHISLGSWFRDYLYIPLGGNRKGLPRQLLNLLIVWALTGLWHGAGWNFVLWGLYFAALLILEKLFLGKLLKKAPAFVGHLYALLAVLFGWVIFNCTSLASLGAYAGDLFRFGAVTGADWNYLWYLFRQDWPELLGGILFCMPVVPALRKRWGDRAGWELVTALLLTVVLALCIIRLAAGGFNPFIYFRF